MNVSGLSQDDLRGVQFDCGSDPQRMYLLQEGVTNYAAKSRACSRLLVARAKAKDDAIKNLARYKFSNFGYHAARWVTLNALIGDKQPNPFRPLVQLAKEMAA